MRKLLCLLLLVCLLTPSGALALEGVCYEVFPGSFADGDGDGTGDLKGLTQKLPYLQGLGVSTLWLTPIHPSPSYHKYDVADYRQIDPSFGTLADFDAFIAACKDAGVAVLMDLVLNHTSAQHPWFLSAVAGLKRGGGPYTDYYNFSQTPSGGWSAVPGVEGWYYESRFVDTMPDLNLDNPSVRNEIRGIMKFWLDRGVAGFRLDAVTSYYTGAPEKNAAFVAWLKQTAESLKPDAYLVGECWDTDATILQMYKSGIDSLFNFPFADVTGATYKAVLRRNGAAYAQRVAEWNGSLRAISPLSLDAPFTGNHDLARCAGFVQRDLQREKQLAALTLLLPGLPYVYYGDELGMSGSGRDENKRLPMLWSVTDDPALCAPPANADQAQRLEQGVREQQADPTSLLNFYRAAIALRSLCPELTRSSVQAVDCANEAICAYDCALEGSAVRVLHNLGDETLTLPVPEGASLIGALDTGNGAAALSEGSLILPPRSTCVLRISPTI